MAYERARRRGPRGVGKDSSRQLARKDWWALCVGVVLMTKSWELWVRGVLGTKPARNVIHSLAVPKDVQRNTRKKTPTPLEQRPEHPSWG